MRKKPLTSSFDNAESDFGNCERISQSIWHGAVLQGAVEMLQQLMREGDFTANSPVSALDRSPLIDIALTVPSGPNHAAALADVARALINNGATLNVPDYKGLLPADYALSSPNPLVAKQILLDTLRYQTDKGLVKSYRPQLDVLFCLAMCKPERVTLHKNITTNLQALQAWLTPDNIERDPLLRDQPPGNLEFWQKLSLKNMESYPKESSSMRQQFRRVAALNEQIEQADIPAQGVAFAEALEQAENRYRLLESWHARRFYAENPSF